jgi:hypothetical protein
VAELRCETKQQVEAEAALAGGEAELVAAAAAVGKRLRAGLAVVEAGWSQLQTTAKATCVGFDEPPEVSPRSNEEPNGRPAVRPANSPAVGWPGVCCRSRVWGGCWRSSDRGALY